MKTSKVRFYVTISIVKNSNKDIKAFRTKCDSSAGMDGK